MLSGTIPSKLHLLSVPILTTPIPGLYHDNDAPWMCVIGGLSCNPGFTRNQADAALVQLSNPVRALGGGNQCIDAGAQIIPGFTRSRFSFAGETKTGCAGSRQGSVRHSG